MNLLAVRIVLRPRSLPDVLDLAIPFCLSAWRPLGKLALAALAPIAAGAAYARLGLRWEWPTVWLVMLPIALFVQGLFTLAFGEALFAEPSAMRVRRVAGEFGRRSFAYLVVFVVRQVLALLAGTTILLLPLVPPFLFAGESLLLERVGVGQAFARSRALVRQHGVACFGLWLFTLALPPAGAIVADLAGDAVVSFVLQLGRPVGYLWTDGGSGFAVLGALLALPVAAAARFLGYIDLRTRKEGWDIQLRFRALLDQDEEEQRRRAA
jgi:hypothetical protein